jgi:hypothetical protein
MIELRDREKPRQVDLECQRRGGKKKKTEPNSSGDDKPPLQACRCESAGSNLLIWMNSRLATSEYSV